MTLQLIILILSLAVLVKSSDGFVQSAERIGRAFGLPAFIIGVTIVALGTSLPELISSIMAVIKDSSEIVTGGVVGSNIANICLILGIGMVLAKKLDISHNLLYVDLPFLVGSAGLMAFLIWDGGLTFLEGLILLSAAVVYVHYTITHRQEQSEEEPKISAEKITWKTILILLGSCLGLFLGAKFTIDSVIELSALLGIGTEIIAMSLIAVGTSLPELMVTISAVRKGHAELAVGNVIGSNVFNSLVVMGIPVWWGELFVPKNILTFSLPLMLGVTLLCFFMTQEKQITRWEGGLLLLFYAVFLGKIWDVL